MACEESKGEIVYFESKWSISVCSVECVPGGWAPYKEWTGIVCVIATTCVDRQKAVRWLLVEE